MHNSNGLYRILEKRRIPFRDMARIEVGLLFLALSMVYSTMVQALIYNAPPCYNYPMECIGWTADSSQDPTTST